MGTNRLAWLLPILLASCAPSQADVERAIAETQTAQAVLSTVTPTPSAVPTATETPTPVPTSTPSGTPTPTPDVRVFDAAPRSVILTRDELPPEGRFYLYDESPHRNSEIISGWGAERGAEYLDKTGRIDSWMIDYERGTTTTRVPEFLTINTVIYRDATGRVATEEILGRCDANQGFNEIEDPKIGDASFLCLQRETQPNGKDYLIYYLNVGFRNFGFQFQAFGYEDSFDLSWLLNVAELQIAKLGALPLTELVTYSP